MTLKKQLAASSTSEQAKLSLPLEVLGEEKPVRGEKYKINVPLHKETMQRGQDSCL